MVGIVHKYGGNVPMGMLCQFFLRLLILSGSVGFPVDREVKPEAIMAKWDEITRFGELARPLIELCSNIPSR